MGVLYAPADNQAPFQTAAYFSHQLPLSARLATGIHMDGMLGKQGKLGSSCTACMSNRRLVEGPRIRLDELMKCQVQIVALLRSGALHNNCLCISR